MAQTSMPAPSEAPLTPSPNPALLSTARSAALTALTADLPTLRSALTAGVSPSSLATSALSKNNPPEVYACLLDAGLDHNYQLPGYNGSALVTASRFWEALELLLERGARWEGRGALQVAAGKGLLGNVRVLVEKGGEDVNEVCKKGDEKTAMQAAREGGNEDVVRFLGERGGE
ncbi:MAG: hypothetical protein L6R37_005681 [Teloschistes peruensis]|nr:MAG: hypothetical protein L6R37_005681 [Teloschistes peruensis]